MFKRLFNIFIVFFKIGALTIGSGYAMLPIMRNEFCVKRKWICDEDMTDVLGLSQSLPGVVAANTASMIGYKLDGTLGATAGVLGAITPSFIIIIIVALLFPSISDNIYVQKALLGVQAGITATIIAYAIKIGKSILKDMFSITLMTISLVLGLFLNINLFLLVFSGGLLGWIYYTIRRTKDASNN